MAEQENSLCLYVGGEKGAEKIFPLNVDKMVIGREPDCGLMLPDPSISKKHARILLDGGRTMIVDGVEGKRSSNGVYVNETRISSPVTLKEGDVVKMGVFRFEVRYTFAMSHSVTLQEAGDAAGVRVFLERGDLRKTRETDVAAKLTQLGVDVAQAVKIFDETLDLAMDGNELQRVAFISRAKQEYLSKHPGAAPAPSAKKASDADMTITDTNLNIINEARTRSQRGSSGVWLKMVLIVTLVAALALGAAYYLLK